MIVGEGETCSVAVKATDEIKRNLEAVAEDLCRSKGQRAVVLDLLVNFDEGTVQLLSPRHIVFGNSLKNANRELMKRLPWYRRW